jgi:hypothetical protein
MTVIWWDRFWSAPTAGEVIDVDLGAIYKMAQNEEDYWRADSPQVRRVILAEQRQQEARFGLDPLARRRLEWGLEQPEEAAAPAPEPEKPRDDPRNVLRMVRPA